MNPREHFSMLAGYHVWAHGCLLDALGSINDVDYHADQGLFFRSIHRTLNHLLLVDLLWQGRLSGVPFPVSGLDQELVKERAHLRDELQGARELAAPTLGVNWPMPSITRLITGASWAPRRSCAVWWRAWMIH